MNALRIIRQVDEALLAALPELRPWQGATIELIATSPEGIASLPSPPRRLPAGAALGLLRDHVTLSDEDEQRLLEEARQERFG